MLLKEVYLDGGDAKLDIFVTFNNYEINLPPKPAMLILPGGGYEFCSAREAEPIAREFNTLGFNCFVLYYSINEDAKFPKPLKQVSEAIVHIKRNAKEYDIIPDRVFVCGFSAGGHLAASIGTLWHTDDAKIEDMQENENKPAGMVLCYPVITAVGPYMNHVTSDRMMGRIVDPDEEEAKKYSLQYQVTDKTVPAFIWNTRDDEPVPTQNSLMFVDALERAGRPFEYHCYGHGVHGLSLANKLTSSGHDNMINREVSRWPRMVCNWIEAGEAAGDFD